VFTGIDPDSGKDRKIPWDIIMKRRDEILPDDRCFKCDGTGRVEMEYATTELILWACPQCRGTGRKKAR